METKQDDWKSRLRVASYKGVEFYTELVSYEFGNDLQRHNTDGERDKDTIGLGASRRSLKRKLKSVLPGSVVAQTEPDAFFIDAYMIGKLYDNRKLLIEKLKEEDPGILVHPTLGEMLVIPGLSKVRWSNRAGGIEYFQLQFEQAVEDNASFPNLTENISAKIEEAVAALDRSTQVMVTASYQNTGESGMDDDGNGAPITNVVQASRLEKMQAMLDSFQARMNFGDTFEKISAFRDKLSSIRTSIMTLVNTPAQWMAELNTIALWFRQMYSTPADAYKQLELLFGDTTINPLKDKQATNTQLAVYRNEGAQTVLLRQAVLCQMVSVLPDIEFAHNEELEKYKARLRDRFDALSHDIEEIDGGDDIQDALYQLMALVSQSLSERSQTLPNIREVTFADSLPALVIVYNEYETIDSEEDFIKLNKVQHPLFVNSGKVRVAV